jgi:hypothetical protein
MAESYTIESADDRAPIDPKLLRELRDLLREDDELDLGVKLRDRQPAPGEQGAIPVALEIISTVTPLAAVFASVLKHWIGKHNGISVKIRHQGDNASIQISSANAKEAERLIARFEAEIGVKPGNRG